MLKSFRFRIYPTNVQISKLNIDFGHARFVYNYFLKYSKDQYELGNKTNYYDWAKALTLLKKDEDHTWLYDAGNEILQQSLKDLQSAYVKFFKKQAKYPKFKKKHDKNSFRAIQGVCLDKSNNLIFFVGFREGIEVRIDRKIPKEYTIRNITVSKTPTNKYFVSILVETNTQPKLRDIDPQKAIGIDVGLKDFAILSNGVKIKHPKVLSKYSYKLTKHQRQLSKKSKGSNNRDKARIKVARVYEKIMNVRMDFIQKLTYKLVNDNQVDLFCVEDLNVSNMLKNHYLAKSISDSGWGMFKNILTYKAEWMGKKVVKIDRFYPSSKTCNVCGYKKNDLTLSDRKWECPNCHTIHDRDINAAINILKQGVMLYNTAGTVGINACGDKPTSTKKLPAIMETLSMKQETCEVDVASNKMNINESSTSLT